jgi:hypothetical protein
MTSTRYKLIFCLILFSPATFAAEINGSAFATEGAPLPQHLHAIHEKTILIDPNEHAFGAYDAHGNLLRWGIATAGASICAETRKSCKTKIGMFRIYSLGSASCYSRKYNDAPMPFCMYFTGSQAIHGSAQIEFSNISHGCVRVHIADAQWLRYHFAELPSAANYFRGTKIIILPY